MKLRDGQSLQKVGVLMQSIVEGLWKIGSLYRTDSNELEFTHKIALKRKS